MTSARVSSSPCSHWPLAGTGCAASHIASYKPKRRDYSLDTANTKEDQPQSEGSLWHPGRPASMLFTDARALRANDLVVIKVEEVADAHRSANTDLDRASRARPRRSTAFLGLLYQAQAGWTEPEHRAASPRALSRARGRPRAPST